MEPMEGCRLLGVQEIPSSCLGLCRYSLAEPRRTERALFLWGLCRLGQSRVVLTDTPVAAAWAPVGNVCTLSLPVGYDEQGRNWLK
jgi:hypothetical protein